MLQLKSINEYLNKALSTRIPNTGMKFYVTYYKQPCLLSKTVNSSSESPIRKTDLNSISETPAKALIKGA